MTIDEKPSTLRAWWGMMLLMAEARGVSKPTLVFALSVMALFILSLFVGVFFLLRFLFTGIGV